MLYVYGMLYIICLLGGGVRYRHGLKINKYIIIKIHKKSLCINLHLHMLNFTFLFLYCIYNVLQRDSFMHNLFD